MNITNSYLYKLWNYSYGYLFGHSLMINFVFTVSEHKTNFPKSFQLLFGSSIFLQRFMNLITAILLSIIARCLPMHILAPKLNPPSTKGGRSLHYSSHLSGRNSQGREKYFQEQWFPQLVMEIIVPFFTGIWPRKLSYFAFLQKIDITGPYNLIIYF